MSKNFHDDFIRKVSDNAFRYTQLEEMLQTLRVEWNEPELSWDQVFCTLKAIPYQKFIQCCKYCEPIHDNKIRRDNSSIRNECYSCGWEICILHTFKCVYCGINVCSECMDDFDKRLCVSCELERKREATVAPVQIEYSSEILTDEDD